MNRFFLNDSIESIRKGMDESDGFFFLIDKISIDSLTVHSIIKGSSLPKGFHLHPLLLTGLCFTVLPYTEPPGSHGGTTKEPVRVLRFKSVHGALLEVRQGLTGKTLSNRGTISRSVLHRTATGFFNSVL